MSNYPNIEQFTKAEDVLMCKSSASSILLQILKDNMQELYCERVGYITLNQEYFATFYQIETSINRDDADQDK